MEQLLCGISKFGLSSDIHSDWMAAVLPANPKPQAIFKFPPVQNQRIAFVAPTQTNIYHFPKLVRVALIHCGLMMPYGDRDLVNIGSGNCLLPDGTKPLLKPMLTCHQWGPITFIWGQFHKKYPSHQSFKIILKITFQKLPSWYLVSP